LNSQLVEGIVVDTRLVCCYWVFEIVMLLPLVVLQTRVEDYFVFHLKN
jgi:hypothetical protein